MERNQYFHRPQALQAFLVLCALCFTVVGCDIPEFFNPVGKDIKFSAQTASSQITTKTTYTGERIDVPDPQTYTGSNTKKIEIIDWESGDLIRVASTQAESPGTADYSLTPTERRSHYAYASATPTASDGHGLQWGTGEHTFYALYPAPSTSGAQSGLSITAGSSSGVAEVTLPAAQNYATPRSSKSQYDKEENHSYYGDMRLAYMTAATKGTPTGDPILLSFTPIVTTFYVTVKNTTDENMTLSRVELSSAASALTGTYRATISDVQAISDSYTDWKEPRNNYTREYDYSQGGSWVTNPTHTTANSSIYCEFSNITLLPPRTENPAGDSIVVALFALPRNITQLTLTVTSEETGSVSLPLKYNGSWIEFTGGNKINLNNIGVPDVDWVLTVDKTRLEYDYTGIGTAPKQEFTITSTKTIGLVTYPANWKTQVRVKNSSDQYEWIDLENNGRDSLAWLNNFPLDQTGKTNNDLNHNPDARANAHTYLKDVTTQPVISHEARLKSNKVYKSDGTEYDNSTQNKALDLSKYNFINRRQEAMRTTANTYIVAAPGWYKIPMIYGNLIENNTTVANACKGARWALGHLDYFKKATDANIYLGIDYPWLQTAFLDHCRIHWEKYTHWNGSSAETNGRQWSSGSDYGVVDGVDLGTEMVSGQEERFMYFHVDETKIRPGNVLLATYGDNNDCCWSWQIWITDQDMNTKPVGSNNVLPVNLGWVDDTEGQYYKQRSAVLKFVSTEKENLETEEVLVIQPELERVSTSGWQTYYQWGRKDPFSPDVMNVYNDDGTINKSIKHPSNIMYDESTSGSDEYYDWTSANYNNLWDSQNTNFATDDNPNWTADPPNHKTVYDPSPRGFSAPPDAAWDDFGSSQNYSTVFNNGLFLYTSSAKTDSVFFPASGYINYNATVVSDGGSGGYYWTIRPGKNVQRRASYCLRFQRDGLGTIHIAPKQYDVVSGSPFSTMAYRALAYSVRPVQFNRSADNSDVITGAVTKEIVFADYEADWGWNSGETNLKAGVTKTVPNSDVSIYVKGNNSLSANDPKYIASKHTIVLGNENEMTISVPSGQQIISITITYTADDGILVLGIPSYADVTATSSPNNGGGFSDGKGRKGTNASWDIETYSNGVFTPTANAVKFTTATTGGSRSISGITVTYK